MDARINPKYVVALLLEKTSICTIKNVQLKVPNVGHYTASVIFLN